LSGFRVVDGSASAIEAGSTATTIVRRVLRILPVYRV
jgi:peptidoglycan/LPS O-acetylase OafA/YrhL